MKRSRVTACIRVGFAGAVTAVALGSVAAAVHAVSGSDSSGDNPAARSPVIDPSEPRPSSPKPTAGAPAVHAPIEADARRARLPDLSAHLTPAAAGRRVTTALKETGAVKKVTVTSEGRKSAITVEVTRNDDSVDQGWYADLAAGAAAQLASTTQTTFYQAVSSATAVGPDATGAKVTVDLGLAGVALDQAFHSPTDAALIRRVREAAKRFGLSVADIQIAHPLESALSVTLVVSDDVTIDWTTYDLNNALAGRTPDVEGLLVQLVAPDGTPLLQGGASYRSGTGRLWFAPGQDGRFGAIHGKVALD